MMFSKLRFLLAILIAGFAAHCVATEPACLYRAGAATIDLPGAPFAAEPSADGCWLYVSLVQGQAGERGAVAVLHNDDGAFVLRHSFPLDGEPAGLRVTHDGKQLFVADGDGISVLDARRLQVGSKEPLIGKIAVGPGTVYLVISDDDRTVFASEERAARIAVIDLERLGKSEFGTGTIVGTIPTGIGPVGLALSGKGDRLFATSQRAPDSLGLAKRCPVNEMMVSEGLLSVIDVARARVDPRTAILAIWQAGCGPVRVVLGPGDREAWVSARGEDAVYRFDVASLEGQGGKSRRRRVAVGPAPVGLALSPAGDAIWLSNSNRFAASEPGTLERIDLTDDSRRVFPTGRFPRDLRFLPDGHTLVVTVFGSSQLQVVPLPSRDVAQ